VARPVLALRQRLAADGLPGSEAVPCSDAGERGATLVRPALERGRDLAPAGALDRRSGHAPARLARTEAYPGRLGDECQRVGVEGIVVNRALGRSPADDRRWHVQGRMAADERAKRIARHRRGTRHAARAGTVHGRSGAPYGDRDLPHDEGPGQARDAAVPDQARVVRPVCDGVGRARLTIGAGGRRLTPAGEVTRPGQTVWDRRVGGGAVEASGRSGDGRVWEDPAGPPAADAADPAWAPAAATARRLHPGGPTASVDPAAGTGARGARERCGGPGAVAGPATSRSAIAPGRVVLAARPGAVPARR
jgi:hypothetical protein